jgi:lipopolysaccharide export system protein LptA
LKLTSEWLTTDLPRPGEHVNRIVAETNVVIDFMDDRGKTNHATGARTVYSYEVKNEATNELVTLSGNAKVENADFVMTGEPIVLNLATRKITADNPVVTPHESLINPNPGTNAPPATTNNPPTAK